MSCENMLQLCTCQLLVAFVYRRICCLCEFWSVCAKAGSLSLFTLFFVVLSSAAVQRYSVNKLSFCTPLWPQFDPPRCKNHYFLSIFSLAQAMLTDLVTCWSFQTTMSKHEEFNDRLDTEFDHFLLDMKPYVLKNPSKAGKVKFPVSFRVTD